MAIRGKTRYCAVCKQPIDAERAEYLPDTRLCTEHAVAIRKFGDEFRLLATQERTNKAGSLKRNYGAVSTQMVRNEEALARLIEEYQASKPAEG